ncbi:DNA cytosine methyltransferase [Altererythrobacter aquiaggeris]|uniref:DNA cytosine methyltransferase n=1 Tax=Aestuarierythrobacter aquiaggeris TaxID=1898396 RepID=UPI0030197A58
MHSIEFCAGAGGQALGLEQAGFRHEALVEIEPEFAKTLRLNRPEWDVRATDMAEFDGRPFKGVELLTAGLPCPPFSVAGKQLGEKDERNLFPAALRLIDEIRPKAVMIENVRGFLSAVFEDYRKQLRTQLSKLGYKTEWRLLNASDFGVSQLRPRVVIVAIRNDLVDAFEWPEVQPHNPPSVGQLLHDLMKEDGWRGADKWAAQASDIAPTLVGGSKKHGGPDLGPTRARKAWASLGVEGKSLANAPPERDFVGMPRLTLRMAARVQGFPDDWQFSGGKTVSYRQIGNAFPPPVARAVAKNLRIALGVNRTISAANFKAA